MMEEAQTDNTPEATVQPVAFTDWAKVAFGLKDQAPQDAVNHQWRFLDIRPGELVEVQSIPPENPIRGQDPDRFPEARFAFVGSQAELLKVLGAAARFQRTGIYVMINRHKKAVFSRQPAGKWLPCKTGTSDLDIGHRRVLMLDFDPDREGGVKRISATRDEQNEAVIVAYRAAKWLVAGLGDASPIATCASGNGMQIWVALDFPTGTETDALIERVLKVAGALWDTSTAKVDQSVRDRKRIGPMAGTTKMKGLDTPDRPHRKVRFWCGAKVRRLSEDELRSLLNKMEAAMTPTQRATLDPPTQNKKASGDKDTDTQRAIEEASAIDIKEVYAWLGGDPASPICPKCKAQDKGVHLGFKVDGQWVNHLKCHHGTCNGAKYSSIGLVCAMKLGEEPKGKAFFEATKLLSEKFGTTKLPVGKKRKGHLHLVDGIPTSEVGDNGKPTIRLGPDTDRMLNEAVAALTGHLDVYTRNQTLVRTVMGDSGLEPVSIETSVLQNKYLAECANWSMVDKEGSTVAVAPPKNMAETVVKLREWPGLRKLTGVTDVPVLRPDGTVWQTHGYDDVTGYLYVAGLDVPTIPEAPSYADALQARDDLLEVVVDAPMTDQAKGAWLAHQLTSFALPAITSAIPWFMYDANKKGTAKTLLANVAGILSTGSEAEALPPTLKVEELEKRIFALLRRGSKNATIDNIRSGADFGNALLDQVMTSRVFTGRILGVSDAPKVRNDTVWSFTGNNLVVVNDTLRRVVPVFLETDLEDPSARTDFRHKDLAGWVKANRGRLVAAILTVLRAYQVAGRPELGNVTMGSYQSWADQVGGCVKWLGLGTVTEGRAVLESRESSGGSQSIQPFLRSWYDRYGENWVYLKDVLTLLSEEDDRLMRALKSALKGTDTSDSLSHAYADLRDAVQSMCDMQGKDLPSTKQLIGKLRAHIRSVCGGLRFEVSPKPDRLNTYLYRVAGVDTTSPTSPSAGMQGGAGRSFSGEPCIKTTAKTEGYEQVQGCREVIEGLTRKRNDFDNYTPSAPDDVAAGHTYAPPPQQNRENLPAGGKAHEFTQLCLQGSILGENPAAQNFRSEVSASPTLVGEVNARLISVTRVGIYYTHTIVTAGGKVDTYKADFTLPYLVLSHGQTWGQGMDVVVTYVGGKVTRIVDPTDAI